MVWQLQEAKNKFSEVVEEALHHGPQTITRHGIRTAVLLSYEDFASLSSSQKKLSHFFRESPLKYISLERDKSAYRPSPRL